MEQNHIIDKVTVEISVNNNEKAYEIKNDISNFLNMEIFPNLETYLNAAQATLPTHTLQISNLILDIDDSQSSLNTSLKNNITESFEKVFKATVEPALNGNSEEDLKTNLLGEQERLLNSLIFFLEKGYMPWWNSNENSTSILEPTVFNKIIREKAFTTKMVYSMRDFNTRERIINQLTDSQILQVCRTVTKSANFNMVLKAATVNHLIKQSLTDRKTIWSLILNTLMVCFINREINLEAYIMEQIINKIPILNEPQNQDIQEQIYKKIAAIFSSRKPNDDFIILKSKINHPDNQTSKKQGKNDKKLGREIQGKINTPPSKPDFDKPKNNTIDETDSLHIQNAGLVLIHPFISNFFKHCNLLDPVTKKLTDPEVCTHLLHYIATGKINQPESSMLFEKFLCNIPLQQSISRHIKLSRKQKSEAAKLIGAVQQNWSAMKTSSVELLQNEFFQRPGKLMLKDNPLITVEKKTQDILLNKLSWGLGFIKLPWQEQFIYINW